MAQHQQSRTSSASAAAAALVAGAALTVVPVGTAAARPDVGSADPAASSLVVLRESHRCPRERVGTQFIACDDLTGAGAHAPSWVPQHDAP